MQTIFSTKDVQKRDRFASWHEVACAKIVGHHSQADDPRTFHATMEAGQLGRLSLIRFGNSAMSVKRSREQIRHADDDDLFLCQQLAGKLLIEQSGREVTLSAHDMTLIDPLIPYVGKFSPASDLLIIKVVRREVECRVGNTKSLTACLFPSESGPSRITSAYMRALPETVGRLAGHEIPLVESQLSDLIATCLKGATESRRPTLSTARSDALVNLHIAVRSVLADPILDAEKIAKVARISVRYANSLLATEQTSLMRLVLRLRLERCAAALSDSAQSHRTIGEIAYSWGFADLTHFGRTFKAAYGALPSDYRKARRADHRNARATT